MMFATRLDWGHGEPHDGEILKIAQEMFNVWLVTVVPDDCQPWYSEQLVDRPALLFRNMPGGSRHVVYSNGHNLFDPNPMQIESIKDWPSTSAMLRIFT